VTEFDEFLHLKGCTHDRHLFIGGKDAAKDSKVECRIDFYQTPSSVIASVFAKKTQEKRSTISIEPQMLRLDLLHLDNKRFQRNVELYGRIDVPSSTYKVMGTKVEFNLQKATPASWPCLERGKETGETTTFGV